MIRSILDFCIRERLIILIASVAIIAYGWYSTKKVPLDAIPNVGENQVIVLAEWPGRSPKDMEDQITYPLSVALQAVPGAKNVRGKSMFGFSFVQVTFDDSVDFYWARSRVAEQLTTVSGSLPDGVTPRLAPDATALGQILLLRTPAAARNGPGSTALEAGFLHQVRPAIGGRRGRGGFGRRLCEAVPDRSRSGSACDITTFHWPR